MSIRVLECLRLMGFLGLTTLEDRVEIDREIERRTGVYCGDAIDRDLTREREFEKMTCSILKRKKRRIKEAHVVV